MDVLPGLLALSQWLDERGQAVKGNLRDPAGLFAAFEQEVQQGAAKDKSAWDASRSVMPEVRAQGIQEINQRGQELGGLLGTFVGVKSLMPEGRMKLLAKAKELSANKTDPVEVWQRTGWTNQFPDRKWRYEVSDDKALLKGVSNIDKGITKADALDHPSLYAAHPDVQAIPKDIQFGSRVPIRGSYSTDGGEAIKASGVDPNDALGITLHEGQHAVQRREGFAKGGNPLTVAGPMYDKLNEEMVWLSRQMDRLKEQKYSSDWPVGAWDRQMAELKSAYDAAMASKLDIDPDKMYRRLAGEAEARLTQARMNLTPAERSARPPWLEFDVPREQQIVRGLLGEQTGPAMSVETPKGIIKDWRWKGKDKVKQEVGVTELPPYIADNYGQFMKEQRGRADAGELGARDLLKAYGITRSSVNRGARDISDDLVQGSARPEGYMAEWLLSPQGKAYLDAAEKGQVNAEAIADIQKRFVPFGMADTLANDLTYAAQQLPAINGSVNAAVTGPVDQWRSFAQSLNGIGPAKSGFIASLLGRGDLPTLDARQLALHTGKPAADASKYMRRGKGKGGDAAVDRLADRQKAMGVTMDKSLSPFYQHLTHHSVWDKIGGTQTTHEDLIRAMKLAGLGGFGLLGAGAYGSEQQ